MTLPWYMSQTPRRSPQHSEYETPIENLPHSSLYPPPYHKSTSSNERRSPSHSRSTITTHTIEKNFTAKTGSADKHALNIKKFDELLSACDNIIEKKALIEKEIVDPCILYYLLENKDIESLENLLKLFEKHKISQVFDEKSLITILSAENNNGVAWLFDAMVDGNDIFIEKYLKILKNNIEKNNFPKNILQKIFLKSGGKWCNSGLLFALKNNHVGVIKLVPEWLNIPTDLSNSKQISELKSFLPITLAAMDEEGKTGLAYAEEHSYNDAVKAFIDVLYDSRIRKNLDGHSKILSILKSGESWYEKKKSPIHGEGIFSTWDMPEAMVIFEYTGQSIDKTKFDNFLQNYNKENNFLYRLRDNTIIDASVGGNNSRYINHSCAPNCKFEEDLVNKKVYIVTSKKINKGEELSLNYALLLNKPIEKSKKTYKCHCGAPRCTGTMLLRPRGTPEKRLSSSERKKHYSRIAVKTSHPEKRHPQLNVATKSSLSSTQKVQNKKVPNKNVAETEKNDSLKAYREKLNKWVHKGHKYNDRNERLIIASILCQCAENNDKHIDLSNQYLGDIKSLPPFPPAEHINLSKNKLRGTFYLDDQPNLILLNINGNNINELKANNLPKLKTLLARDNKIKVIHGLLRDLEGMDISGNPIEKLPHLFKSLKWLEASDTKLKEDFFEQLPFHSNLNWINLSKTNLEGTVVIPYLDKLCELYLSDNAIEKLIFSKPRNKNSIILEVLDVARTKINTFPENLSHITLLRLDKTDPLYSEKKLPETSHGASSLESVVLTHEIVEIVESPSTLKRKINNNGPILRNPDNPDEGIERPVEKLRVHWCKFKGKLNQKTRKNIKKQIQKWLDEEGTDSYKKRFDKMLSVEIPLDDGPERGESLFAKKSLKQFKVLGPYAGVFHDNKKSHNHKKSSSLFQEVRKNGNGNISKYLFQALSRNRIISAYRSGNVLSLMNTAKLPGQAPLPNKQNNVSAIIVGKNMVFYITNRAIAAGEELLIDYGRYYGHEPNAKKPKLENLNDLPTSSRPGPSAHPVAEINPRSLLSFPSSLQAIGHNDTNAHYEDKKCG